jgi:uncharacterized protein (DUF983 family)
MSSLVILAQAGALGSLGHYLIVAIVACAIVGIALIAARQAGVVVPPFVSTILWIVLAAAIAVVAIRALLGLA